MVTGNWWWGSVCNKMQCNSSASPKLFFVRFSIPFQIFRLQDDQYITFTTKNTWNQSQTLHWPGPLPSSVKRVRGGGQQRQVRVRQGHVLWHSSPRWAVSSAFGCLLNGSCHLPSGWRRETRQLPFLSSGPEDARPLRSELTAVTGHYSRLTRDTGC